MSFHSKVSKPSGTPYLRVSFFYFTLTSLDVPHKFLVGTHLDCITAKQLAFSVGSNFATDVGAAYHEVSYVTPFYR